MQKNNKMKFPNFLLLLSLLVLDLSTSAQRPLRLVARSNGNLIIFGTAQGGLAFNNGDTIGHYSNYQNHFFLAEMDSSGLIKWTKNIKGNVNGEISICQDIFDNIYIAGGNYDTLRFDSTNYLIGTPQYLFVAKFDSSGQFIWARQSTGSGGNYGNIDVAVDPQSNVYLTGNYSNDFTFGSLPPISNNSLIESLFIVKFDSLGNAQWLKSLNSGGSGQGSNNFMKSIAVDLHGNAYCTGYFGGTFGGPLHFGTLSVTANGNGDLEIFLAKCDSSGNPIWLRKVEGMTGSDFSEKIIVDNYGNTYLTGFFYYGAKFGNLPAITANFQDIFTARFDSSGNAQWVRQGSQNFSNYNNDSKGISFDQFGNIFTLGNFNDSIVYPPLTGISASNGGGFIVKQDSTGIPFCISNLPLTFYDIAIKDNFIFTIGENYNYVEYQFQGFVTNKYVISRWDNDCNHLWDSSITHITAIPWGVAENKNGIHFRIFPNPSSNIINIEILDHIFQSGIIEIQDITGRVVFTQKIENVHHEIKLDLTETEKGVYILKITSKFGSVSKKIIKT